ncbi:hypothetical protein SAMN02745823_03855, partial [Sporobacter termitidis DSM 10068]
MSVIKRGFLYITRKRGRSILLLVIMFVAAVLTMLGLAIKSSADRQADAVRKSLANSFTIERDEAALQALVDKNGGAAKISPDKVPFISAAVMSRILKLDHITGYYSDYYDRGTSLLYVDVQLHPGSNADAIRRYQKNPAAFADLPFDLDQATFWMHIPSISYCNDSGLHEFFRNGAFALVQGRHIREGDVNKAVISTDLARRNNLSVGDTFTAEMRESSCVIGGDYNKIVGEPIKLEIVGLFDINFSQEASFETDTEGETYVQTAERELAENMIFSDPATELQIASIFRKYSGQTVNPEYETAPRNPVIFVDDPENLEAAISEVKAIQGIDWNYFTIKADDSTYKTAVRPLTQLGTISGVLIAIAVVG